MSDAKVDINQRLLVATSGQIITVSGNIISEGKVLLALGSGIAVSIAGSGETIIVSGIDVSHGTILETQLACVFGSGATAGATVNLYASLDGTTFDTSPNAGTVWVTTINSPGVASSTKIKTGNPADVAGLNKVSIYVANNDAVTLSGIAVIYALYQ